MSAHPPLPMIDRIRGRLALLLARLPDAAQYRLSRRAPIVIDGQTLDPALQMLTAFRPRGQRAPLTHGTPSRARERFRREILSVQGPRTPVAAVRELTVDGGAGPLPARHYAPPTVDSGDTADAAPLLVYFHGGGFMIGDLDTHDEACRLLCIHGRQHVLSVAYRLAPENPFPAAVDDAVAAFRWAQAHSADLGCDARRVAVGGDSAGGNLASVVALLTRDDRPPAAQLLIYPPTDRTRPVPSWTRFDEGFFLSLPDRMRFHELYVGGTGVADGDPRVSPIKGDLAGLPPALVISAGFDVLRDEAEAYAHALAAAGTPCTLHREPGMGHGFVQLTGVSRGAKRATIAVAERWRGMLAALRTERGESPAG
jgi:acetyl esterase